MSNAPADVARAWLQALTSGEMKSLRVAPGFAYTGPLGSIQEVDGSGVASLTVAIDVTGITALEVIEADGLAAITYEIHTRVGSARACDWVFLQGSRIREVETYYDQAGGLALLRLAEVRRTQPGGAIW